MLLVPFIHFNLIGNLTMAGNLTDELHKWILKQYWKTENNERVKEQWVKTFSA